MASTINKLSAAFVAGCKIPGWYGDGGGLYLQVAEGSKRATVPYVTRSYVLRYKIRGTEHRMGLGDANVYKLHEARERRRQFRQLIDRGIDPIEHRKEERSKAKAEAAKRLTFREAAVGYIADNQSGWRSEVHRDQWRSSLDRYVFPSLGDLQVSDIETAHVVKILRPIWTTKTETAKRVRGRIEAILDWSTANGFREGPNPARWTEHLEHILPKLDGVEAESHAALPYGDLPPFFAKLIATPGLPARALETLILTAVRTGDIRGARWSEFDLDAATWIIPARTRNGSGRSTKTGQEHRVPLGPHLLALLRTLPRNGDPSALVFGCGHNTLRDLKDRLLPVNVHATLHGFRSSFRDWAHETNQADAHAEQALNHVVGTKLKRRYLRSDALHQRRPLMMAWEAYCTGAR
jgi:integrase